MDNKTVFTKTAKGIEEMERRTFRLPQKTRQILILADGKRDVATLASMVAVADVEFVLEQLLDGGFLSSSNATAKPETATVATPAPSNDEPAPDAEEKLKAARTFIINTTESIVGVFGSGLIEQARKAQSIDDLRRLERDWSDVIFSEAGKKRGAELKSRLADLLA